MSLRYPGHAKINPSAPTAIGVCDSCGFQFNHNELQFQYLWRGNDFCNTWFLVCPQCVDIAAEFVRPVILGPDPIPIRNPRIEQTTAEEGAAPSPVPYVPPIVNVGLPIED